MSIPDFNSTMVRLKVTILGGVSVGLANFNSTMVRLKEVDDLSDNYNVFVFQFHYGTIKS